MALKATIKKATIHLSDMDRHYYDTIQLTIAQHPSENDRRMMIRLIAYVLNASENLQFGKGVSDEDEAAIWRVNYSDVIELWIELGQLDEKRLKKACNRAQQVKLYCYGSSVDTWWQQSKSKLNQLNKLSVESFSEETSQALELLANRSMEFQVSIQDGQCWLTCGEQSLLIELDKLK
ncbi:YaeQ family protein [Colwellia sp. MB02u-18]|uniref:YaeQ family protein n=1 Tax=unclassified Colwellia TaxID=196834 RepID=UPI0015F6F436|nr:MULTISPECIES: YaeQ family protein [unclassified Colwellia]MBA6225104.1 YaeQ family protein [Colwellia sp. MB3u-45]MBA6268608.1 YaeQ family protein [Colwellia sp. MB3u-43]MBA6296467.1 YaeQ family protein [Colwellia sp. MB02u-9]MBA6321039.1 YaeQ family protein [Colwellia sp. MB02u-19]MBA6325592.1 YaeQ family protein [Colwellia sp. MB02u-18]